MLIAPDRKHVGVSATGRRRTLRTLPILALVVAAACGTPADTATDNGVSTTVAAASTVAPSTTVAAATTAGQVTGFPVTLTAANGEVTIEERPERIVSLSPTGTEILFAIGAGEQVVAVDEFSNYPEEAPTTDLSGFEPNLEAIAAHDPDLVVVSDDLNDVVSGLTAIGFPVVHHSAAQTLDDTYYQIEQLGAATGNPAEASALVESMETDIEELTGDLPEPAEPTTYYHELDSSFFTVTSETFLGQIYALAGLENIADAAEGAETLYPQLSAEFIIAADPDLIFLADTKCCGESPETVAARPGWDQLTAVSTGRVVPLDDDVASRWGPRVVDFLEIVVEESAAVPAGAG